MIDKGYEDVVIFCTTDVVVLRGGVIRITREKVAKLCPEIPVDKIILGATHTHSGGTPPTGAMEMGRNGCK